MADKHIREIMEMVKPILESGGLVYLKWTCPKCGERVTADEANTYHADGYIHTEPYCGYHYKGTQYGFLVVYRQ